MTLSCKMHVFCLLALVLLPLTAHAEQGAMRDILAHTLKTNPSLVVQRQALATQIEDTEQAFAFLLPSLAADGNVTGFRSDPDPGGRDHGVEKNLELSLSQFLYRGGQTDEGIRQQLNLLKAQEFVYRAAVQDVFVDVITAAAQLDFARKAASLTEQNAAVIARQTESVKAGFEYGELTRTDVAQARSRYARAYSDVIRANGDLESALAGYTEITNINAPTGFTFSDVSALIPDEKQAYIDRVLQWNPEVVSQLYTIEGARRGVKAAKGVLMPQLELVGGVSKTYEPIASNLDDRSGASLGITASLPIFNRGLNRSDIRKSQTALYSQKAVMDDIRYRLRSQAVTQWYAYIAANAEIEAREQQVRAAQIAKEGVSSELGAGTRSVLDVLDADQELIDARNALLAAQRDQIIASYRMVSLMGQLTPEAFSLTDQTLNHPQLVGDGFGKSFGQLFDPLVKVKNAVIEAVGG